MRTHLLSIFITSLLFYSQNAKAEDSWYKFTNISTLNGLPSNDVQKVYQDREGFIWIATRNGLSQYNGYEIKAYKSKNYNLLSSNNIYCMVEDQNHRLWIGTNNGLNVLDKTTDIIHKIERPEFVENAVSCVLVTRNGKLFICTDKGLYQYIAETDSCIVYNKLNTGGILLQTTVKSLLEDSRGDLWIGTWNEGLYRYETETGKWYAYPQMNPAKSAHVIFEDSQKRIWIGTWGYGLYLLENIYNPKFTTWKVFSHNPNDPQSISDNIVYDIQEDHNNSTLWIGTRSGLSVLPMNASVSFTNYSPAIPERFITGNEVNSLFRDTHGLMWMAMIGSGVSCVNTQKPTFNVDRLNEAKRLFSSNSVRSIMVENDQTAWLGIGTYGLFVENRQTGRIVHCSQFADFKMFSGNKTITCITKSLSTGKIWIATYGDGVFCYDRNAVSNNRVVNYSHKNTTWLTNDIIYAISEDSRQNVWIGLRGGLSMMTKDGTGVSFDAVKINNDKTLYAIVVTAIAEDSDGSMWLATINNGIIRLTGSGVDAKDYHAEQFSVANGKLDSDYGVCLFRDRQNRIWAGIDGNGLNLYDAQKNVFVSKHDEWNLPGDIVFGILSDRNGDLWISTNAGLARIKLSDNLQNVAVRSYTVSNGLQDNIFNRDAAFMTEKGELIFGGHQGYNYFYPDDISEDDTPSPVAITDIKVFNQSWNKLQEKEKNRISKLSPEFTREITLDYQHNNFSIEFASLCYIDPAQNQYAYRLEGFDHKWIYTDASRRFAYYNNLSPGKYQFRLRAANTLGVWSDKENTIEITILPPPWKTWWAYIIYTVVLLIISVGIYRTFRNRQNMHNSLHLKDLEKSKVEELNHIKLQFFTNITHELLTPLTIISAVLDELKILAPAQNEYYQTMTNNINRLIRLLQQILEFRKAETGNLKLKVSQGDLANFAQNKVDSFRPLMKKKMLHFSLVCNPEPFPAYFDPDKMDKIMYNLLSNAAKYNSQGGTVWIDLSMDETKMYAVLKVRDNGQGMSDKALDALFKRFYEGDYRKFNTIGTGIGLSLTKDLIDLHGGSIVVASEPGKGTEFTVHIPVRRESYKESEIDDTTVIPSAKLNVQEIDKYKPANANRKIYTLLLLEDNEELLNLMVKLLGEEYNLFTGNNGKDGVEIIENEDIDLIVTDIMMPEMDGIEFCKYVKNNLDTCHIPLILLTAKSAEEDRVEAYDSGSDAFISKPFNLSVLHSRIGNLLKAKERVSRDFKKQLVFEVKDLDYTSMDEEFMNKAISIVQEHLADSDFDSEQLQNELATSKATLYRKLKSLTGLNSSAFIRNIRLKAACQIMDTKKHIRISELAYAVGFNDPKYFSACFKKEFGMQPSEYISRFTDKAE
ncbi:MAG: response regulator [Dysgonamonadaceae bacterium]|nr:response regulator [Dysgonamonadaceae bacterium]